jgi:hypothetical protein
MFAMIFVLFMSLFSASLAMDNVNAKERPLAITCGPVIVAVDTNHFGSADFCYTYKGVKCGMIHKPITIISPFIFELYAYNLISEVDYATVFCSAVELFFAMRRHKANDKILESCFVKNPESRKIPGTAITFKFGPIEKSLSTGCLNSHNLFTISLNLETAEQVNAVYNVLLRPLLGKYLSMTNTNKAFGDLMEALQFHQEEIDGSYHYVREFKFKIIEGYTNNSVFYPSLTKLILE